jgi:SAM-dependent methyltransferase
MAHSSPPRQVPIQQRSCAVGKFVGINAYRINKSLLLTRLTTGGYAVTQTPHFYLAIRATPPTTLVIHWFAPEHIDADIGYHFMQELKPLDILKNTQDYGELFGAIVCSLSPREPREALRLYGQNTMRRYRQLLETHQTSTIAAPTASPITVFSTLYRRIFALQIGSSFLDAGCSFGFLPLLIAQRFSYITNVVGIDIQDESFAIARALASDLGVPHVRFEQLDLLKNDVLNLGRFDTVTLLHVLEHFSEEHMYTVLTNLLPITTRRLIIAVPYEVGAAEDAYGHLQLFTSAKLLQLGHWCLQQWGEGHMHYEDSADGLLVLDRSPK